MISIPIAEPDMEEIKNFHLFGISRFILVYLNKINLLQFGKEICLLKWENEKILVSCLTKQNDFIFLDTNHIITCFALVGKYIKWKIGLPLRSRNGLSQYTFLYTGATR